MKKLIVVFVCLFLFACGGNDSTPTPTISPIIQCMDVTNSDIACTDPVHVGTTGLYSAEFISSHPVYSSSTSTLYFELANPAATPFNGNLTASLYYLPQSCVPGPNCPQPESTFSSYVSLASFATKSFSYSLPMPIETDTSGKVTVVINSNSIIVSMASFSFSIE